MEMYLFSSQIETVGTSDKKPSALAYLRTSKLLLGYELNETSKAEERLPLEALERKWSDWEHKCPLGFMEMLSRYGMFSQL